MEDELKHSDIRERTAKSLATRYDVDTTQANMVLATTLNLYDQVVGDWKFKNKDFRAMLGWASLLHEVGIQINSRGVQRHSAYVLSNVDMPGFTQEQQELLATLVRFHRKKIKSAEIPEFQLFDSSAVKRAIALLRLGAMLNIKRQESFLPELNVTASKNSLTLTFPAGWKESRPIMSADLQQEVQYWKAIDLTLNIEEAESTAE